MQSIRTEEQFEQLIDSVQPEVITVSNSKVRSASQKMKGLIEYAKTESKKDSNEKETNDQIKKK